jgi:hypothetical protein
MQWLRVNAIALLIGCFSLLGAYISGSNQSVLLEARVTSVEVALKGGKDLMLRLEKTSDISILQGARIAQQELINTEQTIYLRDLKEELSRIRTTTEVTNSILKEFKEGVKQFTIATTSLTIIVGRQDERINNLEKSNDRREAVH